MLHSVLMGIAFVLFIIGSVQRQSRVNYNAIGLAVLTVALFVGSDLHVHLHLQDFPGNDKTQHNIYLRQYTAILPGHIDVRIE